MIEIYGKDFCPFCDKAVALCEQNNYEYVYKKLGRDFTREVLFEEFPGARTFPQIRIDGNNIGGYDQLHKWHEMDWNEK